MTLVDHARAIAAIEPDGGAYIDTQCLLCTCGRGAHTDDCPWLSMPKIVKALEAAALLADRFARFEDGSGPQEEIDGGFYQAVRAFVAAYRGAQ